MTYQTTLSSLVLSLVLAACGGSATSVPDDSKDPTPTGTSPTPGDTSTPTPTPTPTPTTPTPTPTPTPTTACNSIALHGAMVPITMVAEAAPTAAGGTIADGSYDLVSAILYTGPGGPAGTLPVTVKATIAISGTTANIAQDTSTPSSERLTASVVTTGSDLVVTQTCPKVKTIQAKYSGGTDLVMLVPNDKGQIVAYTYRR